MRPLLSAVLTLLVLSTAQSVLAQSADAFPAKPVTIIVPIAAGGPTDLETRLYAQKMTELMGKPFLVDFKAGAGSVVGTAFAAKAPADGYTLIVIAGNFTVLPAVQKNLTGLGATLNCPCLVICSTTGNQDFVLSASRWVFQEFLSKCRYNAIFNP